MTIPLWLLLSLLHAQSEGQVSGANSQALGELRNVILADSAKLKSNPQIPGVKALLSDPKHQQTYLYIDPDVKNPAVQGLMDGSHSAKAKDFAEYFEVVRKSGTLDRYMMMIPLPPVTIAPFGPGVGLPSLPSSPPPVPALPPALLVDRIAAFIEGRFKGKGRMIAYPADPSSVRRTIVDLQDEVLKGSGFWEKLDLYIVCVQGAAKPMLYPVIEVSSAVGINAPGEGSYKPLDPSQYHLVVQYGSALMAELQRVVKR